jgi:hypothetical protein
MLPGRSVAQEYSMELVLLSNVLWLAVCAIWCALCIAQARADRAKGGGFQNPLTKDELER